MGTIVKFSGAQTIRDCEQASRTLLQALNDHPALLIDCEDVQEADLSFLQLIIATRLAAQRDGKSVGLTSAARGPLLDTLERAGIRPEGEHLFWYEGAPAE